MSIHKVLEEFEVWFAKHFEHNTQDGSPELHAAKNEMKTQIMALAAPAPDNEPAEDLPQTDSPAAA